MSNTCNTLHSLFNAMERFRFPYDSSRIPSNGIYILFERQERGHNADRIVRVGTHTGKSQLKPRLQQHFVNENKDRSIFRKNIGRALLNKSKDPFLHQWQWDLTTRKNKEKYSKLLDFNKQKEMEIQVTDYIQCNLSFVVFQIINKSERLFMEKSIISTISLCKLCGPSKKWLGLYSPKKKIQESGLWLVNELYKEPLSYPEYSRLKEYCTRQ